jgi:hypothetical protein
MILAASPMTAINLQNLTHTTPRPGSLLSLLSLPSTSYLDPSPCSRTPA